MIRHPPYSRISAHVSLQISPRAPQPIGDAAEHHVLGGCELAAVVDSDERRRRRAHRRGRLALGGHGHDVGEVQLTLGVVVVEAAERPTQEGCVHRHHPSVDQLHITLGSRGVGVFHDPRDPTLGVEQHPAVSGGIAQIAGQQADGPSFPGCEQGLQRLHTEQRHVAIEDEGLVDLGQGPRRDLGPSPNPGVVRRPGRGQLLWQLQVPRHTIPGEGSWES